MRQYILAPAARLDLIDLRDYLRARAGRRITAKVLQKIREGMRRIAEMPGIGHLRLDLADESLRFYRVYNYLIIYRPAAEPIAVVRVLDGARDVRSII